MRTSLVTPERLPLFNLFSIQGLSLCMNEYHLGINSNDMIHFSFSEGSIGFPLTRSKKEKKSMSELAVFANSKLIDSFLRMY